MIQVYSCRYSRRDVIELIWIIGVIIFHLPSIGGLLGISGFIGDKTIALVVFMMQDEGAIIHLGLLGSIAGCGKKQHAPKKSE